MANITPAIISNNFTEIKNKIESLDGLAPWVHLDIMDGLFVPPITWANADDLSVVGGKIKVEAHLMVEKPEDILPDWLVVADRLIVHFESTDYLTDIIEAVRHSSAELAVAFLLETPLDDVLAFAEKVSMIQLMSIAEIGYHGQPFNEKVLERVKILHQKFPDVIIQVDGGIDLKTGREVLLVGASNLVAGSAIWKAKDPKEAIRSFQKL